MCPIRGRIEYSPQSASAALHIRGDGKHHQFTTMHPILCSMMQRAHMDFSADIHRISMSWFDQWWGDFPSVDLMRDWSHGWLNEGSRHPTSTLRCSKNMVIWMPR